MSVALDLCCARPERLADCVHGELAPLLADRRALVLFEVVDGTYLADVNDDPERSEEWEAGEAAWLDRARSAHRVLSSRSGGVAVRIFRHRRRWTVEPEPEIPPDVLRALSTFGTDPVLWTAVAHPTRRASSADPAALLEAAPWWIAHGYKEPFLVVGTDDPAEVIAEALGAAVQPAPFRPHRVRVHETGVRR